MANIYDTLVPTSRTFTPGNYAVKTFAAINGVEHRLLYGNVRTQMTMSLTFANITDEDAAKIMNHFDEMKGTFLAFVLAVADTGVKGGWGAAGDEDDDFRLSANGGGWRYDDIPRMESIYPGISTVTVTLRGVH